uniref:PiggyBac transposable element-derived protein domain-containing protein n=1 Tax=Phytophthora infestans TaxID=4787 RepID=Q572E3_PHYIN|nr:hypothetical protein PI49.0430 [Phytophthora infestans]
MEDAEPSLELRSQCQSPQLTLFYYLPKSLWVRITEETNRYCQQNIARRAQAILAQHGSRQKETLAQVRRRLKVNAGYPTHEVKHVIGLLIARMLCPQKRSFTAHWSMTEDGVVPAGSFGRFLGRNRCQGILRDLHFVDN